MAAPFKGEKVKNGCATKPANTFSRNLANL